MSIVEVEDRVESSERMHAITQADGKHDTARFDIDIPSTGTGILTAIHEHQS